MKSIYKASVAYGREHQGTVNIEDFEAGANYVLECIEDAIKNSPAGYGLIFYVIEQLKNKIMKVKVKATGKIIDVRIYGTNANGKPISFYSLDGRDYFKAEELELESEKYETQDEWNSIYKAIEILCERVTPQTVKNDAYYNSLWSDVYKHLDTARGLLSTDKCDNKW